MNACWIHICGSQTHTLKETIGKKKQLLRENGVFSSKFDQSSNIQIYKEESIRKLGLCLTSSEHLDNQELQWVLIRFG